MNIIYTSIDNPISITTNVPSSDIECFISRDGAIKKGSLDYYIIRVDREGDYFLTIKQKSTGASVIYNLRAKKLPAPFASIDNVVGGRITIKQLSLSKNLSLSYAPELDINVSAEVDSFAIVKASKETNWIELKNTTSTFSNQAIELFKSCNKGDILIFKNIKAKGVDSNLLEVPDLTLFIE